VVPGWQALIVTGSPGAWQLLAAQASAWSHPCQGRTGHAYARSVRETGADLVVRHTAKVTVG